MPAPPLFNGELESHVLAELASGESWEHQIWKDLLDRDLPTTQPTLNKVIKRLLGRRLIQKRSIDVAEVVDPITKAAYMRRRTYISLTDDGRREMLKQLAEAE